MKPQVTIRQLSLGDAAFFPDALELLNRTQGRDLFATDYVARKVQTPETRVFGAFLDQELVAVGVAEIIHQFEYYLPFDPDICADLAGKKVGSFSTLCVREDLQGKGIGQMISTERMTYLVSEKVETILGVSWVSGLAHTSNRVFEKMGFRPVKLVTHFYHRSSLEHPFVCPGCGEQPCTCSAVMYRKDL